MRSEMLRHGRTSPRQKPKGVKMLLMRSHCGFAVSRDEFASAAVLRAPCMHGIASHHIIEAGNPLCKHFSCKTVTSASDKHFWGRLTPRINRSIFREQVRNLFQNGDSAVQQAKACFARQTTSVMLIDTPAYVEHGVAFANLFKLKQAARTMPRSLFLTTRSLVATDSVVLIDSISFGDLVWAARVCVLGL